MTDIFDQAQRQREEEPDLDDDFPECGDVFDDTSDFVYTPTVCEDCGQRKCVCCELDELA